MPRRGKLRMNEIVRSVGVKERRLRTRDATDRRRISYDAGTYIENRQYIRVRPSLFVAVDLRELTSLT
jgi:hypothetical protein